MKTFQITPESIEALPSVLARAEVPLELGTLAGFSAGALNSARYLLSGSNLAAPAVLDGAPATVNALVDALVTALSRFGPSLRVRDPDSLSDEDFKRYWAPVREAQFKGSLHRDTYDPRFYIDGEPEAVDCGAIYDLFEHVLFPDEDEYDGDEGYEDGEDDEGEG